MTDLYADNPAIQLIALLMALTFLFAWFRWMLHISKHKDERRK